MQICRSRHETIDRYFKQFTCINNIFARHVSKHAQFARSIINVVQIGIMHKEKDPFDVAIEEPATWPANVPRKEATMALFDCSERPPLDSFD